jgi:hypothetical protein
MNAALATAMALFLRASALAIGIVLLAAAFHKLRAWGAFRASVEGYRLLPDAPAVAVAALLPVLEALAGVALIVDGLRIAGAWLGFATIGVATAAVAINVVRGRTTIACGCGGLDGEQRLSWPLVARNGILLALLAAGASVALPPAGVATQATLAMAALALVALYAAASQLLANQPRLAEFVRTS